MKVSRSQALLARMRACEALVDARPALYFTGFEPLGGQPVFVDRAKGAYVFDVDGNRLIDLLLGFGTAVLGHARPEVTAAAHAATAMGVNPTLLSPLQLELAEKLVGLIPAADQVVFLRTGSDAISAAVRLARAVTGRELVVHWGHHGWHDWCAEHAEGVLPQSKRKLLKLRYNDLDQAKRLFARHRGRIACLVMMPYEIEAPDPGYLKALEALARAEGALFVLDEIRSGFRLAMGGAQERFGLEPDLSAFGKALANGHALSVLAGRRELMSQILKLGLTVTYYRSPDVFAAALATLALLETEQGPATLERIGQRLLDGLHRAFASTGVPGAAVGFPATPFIRFDYPREGDRQRAMRLFSTVMLEQGVLLTPAHHWFVCTAMSEADVDYVAEAAETALRVVARRL